MSAPLTPTFPATRLRRLRQAAWIRSLTAEHVLTPADLIWSMVVHDGEEPRIPVAAMPGLERLNVQEAAAAAIRALATPVASEARISLSTTARNRGASSTILDLATLEVIRVGACYELIADVLERHFGVVLPPAGG